jgi:glycine/D-amino acid oxidase-like deaminating enzyme
MRVAVLGGGLQGCCIALALADRGARVVLFDKNESLLSRAAVANEGKIHLGYMYAGDSTLSTARMMMQGALAFVPFFTRYLGLAPERMIVSTPAAYVVHRDSQRSPEEISGYLAAVHRLVREAAANRPNAYFGIALSAAPREWTAAERDAELNSDIALAAFDSPEVAINPVELAKALSDRIAATARIELRLGHFVRSVDQHAHRASVMSEGPQGAVRDQYDHVVNALWDGRLTIDATAGHRPNRPWLHRLKYGISFRRPDADRGRSATVVLGPFGEVVSYSDGLTYLTWYPECLQGISSELAPPNWVTYPAEPLRSRILKGTLAALSDLVPSLRDLKPNLLSDVCVKGGVIVAWGQTDIDDPQSELHRRFEIGVTSAGRFHSVDPGKLTMAPYFADICADRIAQTC